MLILQLVSAFAIFISLSASVLIPYCILYRGRTLQRNGRSHILSLSNCLASGIFLSTCFLGLIPHVRHQEMALRGNVSDEATMVQSAKFVGTEALILIGFLLIMIIEQVLTLCSPQTASNSYSPRRAPPSLQTLLESDNDDGQPLVDTTVDDDGMNDIIFRTNSPVMEHDHAAHSHLINIEEGLSARTFFLLLGLSVHSLFEGIALGVQGERSDLFNVLVAVMFHEVLCCVAYGISLAQQRTVVRTAVLTTIILSSSIPTGMIMAVMVDHVNSSNSQILRYTLEGLAAGTFVYVASVEMLSAELAEHHGHSHYRQNGGLPFDEHKSTPSAVLKAMSVCVGVGIFWILQAGFALAVHS